MNLNRNPRLEQFDLDDSEEICIFFQEIIDEIFEKMPPGLTRQTKVCDKVFSQLIDEEALAPLFNDPIPEFEQDNFSEWEIPSL